MEHQTFKVGTDEQISLLYNKVAYPSFYIQNVYANGMLALKNDEIDTLFSNRIHYTKEEMPRENMYSCVVKLTYGLFDYYTGGDIPGYPRPDVRYGMILSLRFLILLVKLKLRF